MTKNFGFTLTELLTVIVIISLIAAIAIPKFMAVSGKAKAGEVPSIMAVIGQAEFIYHQESNVFLNIPYASWKNDLNLLLGVEVQPKLFSFYVTGASDVSFLAHAKVEVPFAGIRNTSVEATMDQLDQISFVNDNGTLENYLRSWSQ